MQRPYSGTFQSMRKEEKRQCAGAQCANGDEGDKAERPALVGQAWTWTLTFFQSQERVPLEDVR